MSTTGRRLLSIVYCLVLVGCASIVLKYRREGPSNRDYLTGEPRVPVATLQMDLWRTDVQNGVTVGAEPFTPALVQANARDQGARSGWPPEEIDAQIKRWTAVLVDSSTCFYVKFNSASYEGSAPANWTLTVIDAAHQEHPGAFALQPKDEKLKYPRLYQGALGTMVSLTSSTYTTAGIGCSGKVDLGQPFQLRLDPRFKGGVWSFLMSWSAEKGSS